MQGGKAWVRRAYSVAPNGLWNGVVSVLWRSASGHFSILVFYTLCLLLDTLHGRSTRILLDLGHLHLSKFSPDGSGGSARRTRHARRQGMGPTCLFRRSQRVVERRRVCVVELAIQESKCMKHMKTDAVNVLYALQEKPIAKS